MSSTELKKQTRVGSFHIQVRAFVPSINIRIGHLSAHIHKPYESPELLWEILFKS